MPHEARLRHLAGQVMCSAPTISSATSETSLPPLGDYADLYLRGVYDCLVRTAARSLPVEPPAARAEPKMCPKYIFVDCHATLLFSCHRFWLTAAAAAAATGAVAAARVSRAGA